MAGKDRQSKLQTLRKQIDEQDQQLFELLARRMSLVREVGLVKREAGIPIADPVREARVRERLKTLTSGVLAPWHVEELSRLIMRISRDVQSDQLSSEPPPAE